MPQDLYPLQQTPAVASVQRVNAGAAAPGQTLISITGKILLSASVPTTQPILTTPAGKTFYLTDIFISHDSATVLDTQIQAGGVPVFRAPIKGDTAPVQMAGIETQPQCPAGVALTIVWPVAAGPPSGFFYLAGFYQ